MDHEAPSAADRTADSTRKGLPFSGFGVLFGLALFAGSLTPSLVPREGVLQGLLGGALFAFGYGVALAIRWLWRWLGFRQLPQRTANRVAVLAAIVGVILAGLALTNADDWQNGVRALMGLPPVETTHFWSVLAIAAGAAFVLLALGALVRLLFRAIALRVGRYVPERVAVIIALTTAFLLVAAVVEGVLVRAFLTVVDASYAQLDRLTEPDQEPPTDPRRTGSAASLIDWPFLGRDGRRFVSGITTSAALDAFWADGADGEGGAGAEGTTPVEPLRIYVGLGAAEDHEARAALALEEMQRVGAFGRDVVVVAMPTGTGFIDQAAIEALEYLTRGDVATVAQQYSYMQSPFSLIFEPGYGAEAARALFSVVYQYWTDLPQDERPRLYLYGLSLGALSSERSLRFYEMLGDPINGALWAGPPFVNTMHAEITAAREAGSPAWRPVFEEGRLVRFMGRDGQLTGDAPWGPMRLIYMQHPSDPIVFFETAMLWRPPDWMRPPRGGDVSEAMRWTPVVTALQVAADMALSNNVPLGHGHQYAGATYLAAWVALLDARIDPADLERLKARLGG